MERIFRLLELNDLISVAEANKELKAAAEMVFNHKFKMYKIKVVNTNEIMAEPILMVKDRNFISVRNLQFSFKILRLFGKYILEIDVWATDTRPKETIDIANYERILHYISEYCSNSLIKFGVLRYPDNAFIGIHKPFKNVERISIRGGNITSELPFQINQIFPRMRKIYISASELNYWNTEFIRFPHLEDVCMIIDSRNITPNGKSIQSIVNSNPNICKFHLLQYIVPNVWRGIILNMKNVKNLGISYSALKFKNYNDSLRKN